MNPSERLEEFFKDFKRRVDKGECSPLGPSEIVILQIYKDWEIEHESNIQQLHGSSE